MTKELREGINSQGLDQQWQVLFFIQKITYEIFQVYRNIVTHGLCKPNGWIYNLAFVLDFYNFIISKYQSRYHFDV